MLVKVKDSGRVYYDREQGVTFTGEEVIQTKVTFTVRQLLNDGKLVEVTEKEEPKTEETDESKTEEPKKGFKVGKDK